VSSNDDDEDAREQVQDVREQVQDVREQAQLWPGIDALINQSRWSLIPFFLFVVLI
jgi:hypothetical protein